MFFASSKTEIAQMAAQAAVTGVAAELTANQMSAHTDLDHDSATVQISSCVVGMYVGLKLRPVTDVVVVKTVAGVRKLKPTRKNRKSTTES